MGLTQGLATAMQSVAAYVKKTNKIVAALRAATILLVFYIKLCIN